MNIIITILCAALVSTGAFPRGRRGHRRARRSDRGAAEKAAPAKGGKARRSEAALGVGRRPS